VSGQPGDQKSLIESPEGAAFVAEQGFQDGNDPTAALIATVHQTELGSAGNMWIRQGGEVKRLIDERVLQGMQADRTQLAGEVYRYAIGNGQEIEGSIRLNLAVKGLMESVTQTAGDKEKEN